MVFTLTTKHRWVANALRPNNDDKKMVQHKYFWRIKFVFVFFLICRYNKSFFSEGFSKGTLLAFPLFPKKDD